MIKVYWFSGSGHSLAVASFLGGKIGCDVVQLSAAEETSFAETAVVVFPVYCQNIPNPVKDFLRTLKARFVALVATYGRISYGNVLFQGQKLLRGQLIAGAYVPTGHTFLGEGNDFDETALLPILERISAPQAVDISRSSKALYADLLPGWRSRVSVKLIRTDACSGCGICENSCPVKAIQNGRISNRCIRCLRCVSGCPSGALTFKPSRFLVRYLKKHRRDKTVLYGVIAKNDEA